MKKVVTACLFFACSMTISMPTLASNHTISGGYVQGKTKNFYNLKTKGFDIQYRYEWDSPISLLSSISAMKGKTNFNDADIKSYYASVLAGPALRLNEYLSLYALGGIIYSKSESVATPDKSGKTPPDIFKKESKSLAYGAGVIFNPVESIAVSVGYEGSRIKLVKESYRLNSFNVNIGMRF